MVENILKIYNFENPPRKYYSYQKKKKKEKKDKKKVSFLNYNRIENDRREFDTNILQKKKERERKEESLS